MIAFALPAALQAAAAPAFAPPLETPIRYTVSETRTGDSAPQRFEAVRQVIFHYKPTGFVAEVSTLSVSGAAAPGPGALFEAGFAALAGRTLRIMIDPGGRITGVEDGAAAWTAMVDAIAAAMAKRSPGAPVATLLAPLRGAPAARQAEILASVVAPLIGIEVSRRGAGVPAPVRVPAQGAGGTPAALDGSERIDAAPGGMLRFERAAEGEVSPGRRVRTRVARLVDPRTGVAAETRETTATTVDGRTLTIERTTAVKP